MLIAWRSTGRGKPLTGVRDGRAWVVRTFGNQSAAAFAYMCFAINSEGKMVKDWWKFNVSTDEAMDMQARAL